ncbi:MAG: hypothetical protein A2Y15_06835 [Clostridiales bacterium GWF2_36_10]|nr:MAG: hypothetical protein A2Y15_06835 [Clostridiales bacterium GWF2_36_10]
MKVKKMYARIVVFLIITAFLLPLVPFTNVSAVSSLSSILKENKGCTVNGSYLMGVEGRSTVEDLLLLFSDSSIEIETDSTYVGTGDKIKLMNGSTVVDELTVVVAGDTNGDGQVGALDYLRIKRAVLGTFTLEKEYLLSALVSGNTKPNAKDYLFVKRHFLGTFNLYGGGTMDYNGTKIAYIPIDDRPVNVDRVIYLAESAGYELLMPKKDYYATKLDGNGTNTNGTKYGNREELLKWLKAVDAECDYFVISLDQMLSGGLVNSRIQNNTDLSYEYEIIDYLLQLNENNKVYFFDTVIRLASTVNYNGYGMEEYNILRNYGAVERKILTGNDLTIKKIIDGYKYNKSGVEISSSLSSSEIDSYLAARARKLKIIDYFLEEGKDILNYCYIGVDDSSPKNTIQTNEIAYITNRLNENGVLSAACDELGMMGIARLTADLYKSKVKVSVTYFGGSENEAADSYDIGNLKSTVDIHLNSLNTVITNSNDAELNILILTKPKSLSIAEYSNMLLDTAEYNLENKRPTVIIDASSNLGTLQFLMAERKIQLSSLLGYSSWNTVGNAIGIALSQGVTRYIFLKCNLDVTNDSNISFLKNITFAYVKDINYKIGNVSTSKLLSLINSSEIITSVNIYKTKNIGTVSVSGYRFPWNRSFEATFDIFIK